MGKRKAPVNDQDPSSIDEIFASSSKAQPSSSSSKTSKRPHTDSHRAAKGGATTVTGSKKKKSRPKIDASDPRDDDEVDGAHGEKRKRKGTEAVVETVVDPSTLKKPEKEGRKRSKKDIAEDEAFRDSRGTRRKTEEGFLIYKEAELGINPEAGGTPLCPFDCDCCF